MNHEVRVGIIGMGLIGAMLHLPSLKSHPKARVTAICSRTRERVEGIAKTHQIPQVFTDYREMIDQGNLEAIVVATPDDLHYTMTMDALDAGLHVFCEKPLATTVTQAKEMTNKAEAIGVINMVSFSNRWRPHYRHLKTLVDQGYIGRPYHVHFRFLAGYGREPRYGWRFDRQRANGVLGDLASHMIDLARWYIGDIVKVSAHLGTFVERPGPNGGDLDPANDSAMLLLEFENGAQGTIHVSAVAHTADRGQEQHVLLHGAAGTLEASTSMKGTDWSKMIMRTPHELRGVRQDHAQFEDIPIPEHLWENADPENALSVFSTQPVGVRLFIDAIVEDKPVVPSFYDGLKAQEVIEAANRSHEEGRWITL